MQHKSYQQVVPLSTFFREKLPQRRAPSFSSFVKTSPDFISISSWRLFP
jgi:hypothetical protein